MSQLIMVAVIMLLMGAYLLWGKKRMAQLELDNAGSRAGPLAETMGLKLIEGDPMLNLLMTNHSNSKKANNEETRVILEGSPAGRATRLSYYHRQRSERDFNRVTITTWIRAEVSVAVNAPFPEFEVVKKHPGHYGSEIKPKLAAPLHPSGNPAVDETLVIRAHDARVAHALSSCLAVPATWDFVHIHGSGDTLTFHATKSSISYLGIADQIQQVLNTMAAQLEAAAGAHAA